MAKLLKVQYQTTFTQFYFYKVLTEDILAVVYGLVQKTCHFSFLCSPSIEF